MNGPLDGLIAGQRRGWEQSMAPTHGTWPEAPAVAEKKLVVFPREGLVRVMARRRAAVSGPSPLPCCGGRADGGLCVTTIVFLSAVAVFFFGWPRKCR
jgi:hypothetical protein